MLSTHLRPACQKIHAFAKRLEVLQQLLAFRHTVAAARATGSFLYRRFSADEYKLIQGFQSCCFCKRGGLVHGVFTPLRKGRMLWASEPRTTALGPPRTAAPGQQRTHVVAIMPSASLKQVPNVLPLCSRRLTRYDGYEGERVIIVFVLTCLVPPLCMHQAASGSMG
jgi:hypothetical protein